MMRHRCICLLILLTALVLAACGANHHSIYRHQNIGDSSASLTSIDAKQRVIMTSASEPKDSSSASSGVDQSTFRYCAEPSPDVFSVIAQSLSAGGTFGQQASPASVEATLNAVFSSAEQGSTILRTQTINMLREIMYRTCERYLNGELSDLDMPIQAIRDQRTIVSILAIEQLTGAVTPQVVALGSTANASSGADGADGISRIDEAFKLVKSKQTLEATRQAAYDVENENGACEAIAKKVEDDTELTQDEENKKQKCDKAASNLAAAKLEHSEASAHYATLKSAAALGGVPVRATADGTHVVLGQTSQSKDVSKVASVVETIVRENFNQDEFLLFCIRIMSESEKDGVEPACINYIKSELGRQAEKANLEAARLESIAKQLSPENVSEAQAQSDEVVEKMFGHFWSYVRDPANGARADRAKLDARLRAVFGSNPPRCFAAPVSTQDLIKKCFKSLNDNDQHKMIDLADPELMGDE